MVTVNEAADRACVAPQAVQAWCREGTVAAVKVDTGRKVPKATWDIDAASLDAHLARIDRICNAFLAIGGKEWKRQRGDSARGFKHVRQIWLAEELLLDWCGLRIEWLSRTSVPQAWLDGRKFTCLDGGVGAMRLAVIGVHLNAADLSIHIGDLTDHPVTVIWSDTGEHEAIDMLARVAAEITARTGLYCGEPVLAYKDYLIPVALEPLETS